MKEKNKRNLDVKKFLLEVPSDLWEKWKDGVPRSISINKALIELLRKESIK